MRRVNSSQTSLDQGLELEHLPKDEHRGPACEPDTTDYAHRTFVNLPATVMLLMIALAVVWTICEIEA